MRDGWYLVLAGQRCREDVTIEEMGMKDGDTLHLFLAQRGGKPVIYLFSPETIEAEVKLSLIPQWNLSAIYPVVPIKTRSARSNEQVVWRVRTHSNGDLTADDRIGRRLLVLGNSVRPLLSLLEFLSNNQFQYRCYCTTFSACISPSWGIESSKSHWAFQPQRSRPQWRELSCYSSRHYYAVSRQSFVCFGPSYRSTHLVHHVRVQNLPSLAICSSVYNYCR